MGSFNLACALTHMPIHEDEDVKIAFLVERSSERSLDACAFYQLLTPRFIDATYNDYGRFVFNDNEAILPDLFQLFKTHAMIADSYQSTNISDYDFESLFDIISDEKLFAKPSYMDKACAENETFDDFSGGFTSMRPRRIAYMAIKSSVIEQMCEHNICEHVPMFGGKKVIYRDLNLIDIGRRSHDVLKRNNELLKHLIIGNAIESEEHDGFPFLDSDTFIKFKNEITECMGDNEKDISFFYRFILRANNGLSDLVRTLNLYESEEKLPEIQTLIDVIDSYNINYDKALEYFSVMIDIKDTSSHSMYYHQQSDYFEHIALSDARNTQMLNGYYGWLGDHYHSFFAPSTYAGQEYDTTPHCKLADIVKRVAVQQSEEDEDYYDDED